jgi:hypothetical protein
MCNCGNKRGNFQPEQNDNVTFTSRESTIGINEPYFEYIGKTALSVKGNITGIHYRFAFTGDKQIINHKDAAAMLSVPVLRIVKL